MARFWSAKVDSYSSPPVFGFGLSGRSFMARFSGLEIEPYIVLEGRILSNAFASRDFLWSDHGKRVPSMMAEDSESNTELCELEFEVSDD